MKCHQYADVTHLYLSLPFDPKGSVDTLNLGLEAITGQMRTSKLKLHLDKTEVLLVLHMAARDCTPSKGTTSLFGGTSGSTATH